MWTKCVKWRGIGDVGARELDAWLALMVVGDENVKDKSWVSYRTLFDSISWKRRDIEGDDLNVDTEFISDMLSLRHLLSSWMEPFHRKLGMLLHSKYQT